MNIDYPISQKELKELKEQYGELYFVAPTIRPNSVSRKLKSGSVYRMEIYDGCCCIHTTDEMRFRKHDE